MLHKTDKGLIYGVRGLIHFFKEHTGFLPKEKRTHEKTYVFSHALLFPRKLLQFVLKR